MGSTSVITIGSDTFTVYGSLVGLTSFVNGRFSVEAAAWRKLTADVNDKARTLISATAALDVRLWQGAKTDPAQLTDWPRTGVVDETNASVDSTTVPDRVVQAAYELALLIAANPAVQTSANAGSNIKGVKAGPVDVEYFRPTDGANAAPLPDRIMQLVGVFLSGANSPASGVVSSDGCSAFVDCATDTRSQPW